MRRGTSGRSALVLCGIVSALAAVGAAASVPSRFELGDLTDRSALVFVGTVVERQVAVSDDGLFPSTYVTFDVEEVLKGEADRRLTLRFDGGPVGSHVVRISGVPEFEVGKRHLLFVAGADEIACPLAGWERGKLDFVRHPRTGQEVLADVEGRLVAGVEGDRFRMAAEPAPEKPTVIEDGGFQITLRVEADAAAAESVPAARVLAELQRWLRGRKAGAGAVAPGRVRSVHPEAPISGVSGVSGVSGGA